MVLLQQPQDSAKIIKINLCLVNFSGRRRIWFTRFLGELFLRTTRWRRIVITKANDLWTGEETEPADGLGLENRVGLRAELENQRSSRAPWINQSTSRVSWNSTGHDVHTLAYFALEGTDADAVSTEVEEKSRLPCLRIQVAYVSSFYKRLD